MNTSLTSTVQKLQKYITDMWRLASFELKKYCDVVNLGQKPISLILAHKATLKNISSISKVDIQDTEVFRIDPDIQLKLKFSIERDVLSEEILVRKIMKDLLKHYTDIIVNLDKICSAYEKDLKTEDLSTDEIIKGNDMSSSIAEMLEAVDKFKLYFTRNHQDRKYSLDLIQVLDEPEKVSSLWDVSDLLLKKQELDSICGLDIV